MDRLSDLSGREDQENQVDQVVHLGRANQGNPKSDR